MHIILEAAALQEKRKRSLAIWAAWRGAAWQRAKKMDKLEDVLRPFAPRNRRVMDRSQIRQSLLDMAKNLNIPIIRRNKSE